MSDDDHIDNLLRLGRRLIADEMKNPDVVGAAFDGSLATRRAWATSDLDFTIFPRSSAPAAERAPVPAYRFYYADGPLAKHNQYVDLRVIDGTFVNIHIKTKEALDQLVADYPRSFIESAQSIPMNMEATHFLDGLSIMAIVEDPGGYLARTKAFVAKRRFAPEALDARLELMFGWAERKLTGARRSSGDTDFDAAARNDVARSIAHMWLEAHGRVYSKKEQDSLLAEVVREAGVPEAHDLYRRVLGVDEDEATLRRILGPIADYAARVDMMFGIVEEMASAHVEQLGADVVEHCKAYRLAAALSLRSVPIAFEKRCYAHMAFVVQGVGPPALNQFTRLVQKIAPAHAPALEEACRAEIERSREVWEFFGYIGVARERTLKQLDAATRLLDLTRRHIVGAR